MWRVRGGGCGVGSLKNPGWGKKNASVLDAFEGVPTCIYRENLLNWSRITYDPSSSSFQDWKSNAPSSTYSMQKREDGVPSEKYFPGDW